MVCTDIPIHYNTSILCPTLLLRAPQPCKAAFQGHRGLLWKGTKIPSMNSLQLQLVGLKVTVLCPIILLH